MIAGSMTIFWSIYSLVNKNKFHFLVSEYSLVPMQETLVGFYCGLMMTSQDHHETDTPVPIFLQHPLTA
jgi:hypothetical protein